MFLYFFTIELFLLNSFVADEELGGREGMQLFVLSEKFKALNVGIAIDEGLASPDDIVPLFYGERNVFWVNFHCFGTCLKIKPIEDYF